MIAFGAASGIPVVICGIPDERRLRSNLRFQNRRRGLFPQWKGRKPPIKTHPGSVGSASSGWWVSYRFLPGTDCGNEIRNNPARQRDPDSGRGTCSFHTYISVPADTDAAWEWKEQPDFGIVYIIQSPYISVVRPEIQSALVKGRR